MRAGLKIFLLFIFVSVAFSVQASAQTYEFTTCGAEGRYGPSQSQCDSTYGQEGPNVNIVGEGIQEWTVPETGEYRITVAGAQGGANEAGSSYGRGARISALVTLKQGDNIKLIVGQKGQGNNDIDDSIYDAGGGGGSFVWPVASQEPLVVAGGGAGGIYENFVQSAADANTFPEGSDSQSDNDGEQEDQDTFYNGGSDGLGGEAGGTYHGGAGGGFRGDGQGYSENGGHGVKNSDAVGGSGETNGQPAGAGGFGGGGGGYRENSRGDQGPGGGGGYSGGAGASDSSAGGGGSYVVSSAEDVSRNIGNDGHGYVNIEFINEVELKEDFCNFRGPVGECVMNQTNELSNQQYNVSSVFESRSNAVFEAFDGVATLNLSNSSRISGLWKGSFDIIADRPRIRSGASFRPQNGRIVIGE